MSISYITLRKEIGKMLLFLFIVFILNAHSMAFGIGDESNESLLRPTPFSMSQGDEQRSIQALLILTPRALVMTQQNNADQNDCCRAINHWCQQGSGCGNCCLNGYEELSRERCIGGAGGACCAAIGEVTLIVSLILGCG